MPDLLMGHNVPQRLNLQEYKTLKYLELFEHRHNATVENSSQEIVQIIL